MGINLTSPGGVSSVAGLSGVITDSALRTALALATTDTVRFAKLGLGTDAGSHGLNVLGTTLLGGNLAFSTGLKTVTGQTGLAIDSTVYFANTTAATSRMSANSGTGFTVRSDFSYAFNSTTAGDSAVDLELRRDATDTLAQYRAANAQASHLYGRRDDASNYHRLRTAVVALIAQNVNGASVTLTGAIPAGFVPVGVTSEISVTLGNAGSLTGYTLGDGVDADRWGDASAITAGTVTSLFTDGQIEGFPAAQDIIITPKGGSNFNGTGDIRVFLHGFVVQAQ